jgi:hypothetical protein
MMASRDPPRDISAQTRNGLMRRHISKLGICSGAPGGPQVLPDTLGRLQERWGAPELFMLMKPRQFPPSIKFLF